ncbi:acyl-CoA ligase (AMP-forming), exosortase A system-associated [Steroidobacter sp.]|uniref:acyl-CoA ligase (AMP-forming), exosortase A system-associated n=1 Tax=Steroidobacter sp. TaxID=1978227 RepID=UPI001A5F8455|nr:acyl-CoA ligase (AMP-forming), exosortase A system-associated [Steroidobacter sp.]MBL8269747.1 acyl-CoA ligase (AMP-forming), exosortase A system-associated [Steroidobacter sp.]
MNLLHDLFDASAARFPNNEALRSRGNTITYAELQRRSHALAASLRSHGVGRGDRVAVYLQNRGIVVESALACSRLGAIFVPANPLLKARQLEYLLNDAGACALIASQTAAVVVEDSIPRCPSITTVVWCDTAQAPLAAEVLRYEGLVAGEARVLGTPAIEDDPAALLYTSGSTGRPKGVVVSHRNLVAGALTVSSYLKNQSTDRILVALPLSFDYGLSQVTTAFAVGACAVLTNFSLPAALLQDLVAERITALAGVPTMWMHLATAEWPAAVVQSLRYITNSGGALPVSVIKNLQARLPNTLIYCMYGLTEAFRSTYLDPASLEQRLGSMGKAIPGQEVLVIDADGNECKPGEEGELVHRGSLVTLGYWNDVQLTQQRFKPLPKRLSQLKREEIAVWSGDLVKTDADGFLYFVGRRDNLIKSSGYRISPVEIEETIAELPMVVESAAVGLPDEALGQRIVVAAVVAPQAPDDVAERIRQHCRMQLPAYMVPAEVHLMSQLPRNANGKCDRGALAATLAA